jgi:hypothetical protein
MRIDELIVLVNQYRLMFVSSSSRLKRLSTSLPQSLQVRNFSTIQAARPAGESLSP